MKKNLTISLIICLISMSLKSADNTWLGTTNSNWHKSSNWNLGHIPLPTENVIIPAGTTYSPLVDDYDEECKGLLLQPGAMLGIADQTLITNGAVEIYGQLIINSSSGNLTALDDILWESGSSALMVTGSQINIYGDWTFAAGANVHPSDGWVNFEGSTNTVILCNSANCNFYHLNINKYNADVMVSLASTADLNIDGSLYTGSKARFLSDSPGSIVLEGAFYNSGSYEFNDGTFVFSGISSPLISGTGDFFNNITINCSGNITLNDPIDIRGNLQIESGILVSNSYDILVHGSWTNNVGDTGFEEGTGTVFFDGLISYSYIYDEIFYNLSDETGTGGSVITLSGNITVLNDFTVTNTCWVYDTLNVNGTLNLNKSSCFFGLNSQGYVITGSLDMGGAIVMPGGYFNALDIIDDGIYGQIELMEGELNLHQGTSPGEYIDLNCYLEISAGAMNIYGGYDNSWWAYSDHATIVMSNGILDFKNRGVYMDNSTLYTLTEAITGGTIRTTSAFDVYNGNFTPSGGTLELYGSNDATITTVNGSSFCHVNINKTSVKGVNAPEQFITRTGQIKMAPLSNTIYTNSDIVMTGDLEITCGTYSLSGYTVSVGGNTAIYGCLQMTDAADILSISGNMEWNSGAYESVSEGDIIVGGNWIFHNGCNVQLGNANTVFFSGVNSSTIFCNEQNATFRNMIIQKNFNNPVTIDVSNTDQVRLTGELTVGAGDNLYINNELTVSGTVNTIATSTIFISNTGILVTDSDLNLTGAIAMDGGNVAVHGLFELESTGSLTLNNGATFSVDGAGTANYLGGDFILSDGVFESTANLEFLNTGANTVSGGTIRVFEGFKARELDNFQPTGGTVELAGTGIHMLFCDNGNYFSTLMVNQAAFSRTVMTDIQISNDLIIASGNFDPNGHQCFVGDDVEIHDRLIMKDPNDELRVMGDITWHPGSSENIIAGEIYVSGCWSFEDGTDAQLDPGNTVFLFGANPVHILTINDADAEIGNLTTFITGIPGLVYLDPLSAYPLHIAGNLTITSGNEMHIDDGDLIVDYNTYIESGSELIISTGGSLINHGDFNIHGIMNMQGGGDVLIHDEFNLFGDGRLDISGGSFVSDRTIMPGEWLYLFGTLNMSGGLLELTNSPVMIGPGFTGNITGGTIRIARDFNASVAGTFQPAGGTVEFFGPWSSPLFLHSSNYFRNLTVAKDAGSSLLLTSSLQCLGDLLIASGMLSNPSSCNINVGGDWTNLAGEAAFDQGNCTVYFIGENDADITTHETFHHLTLLKTYPGYDGLEIMDNLTATIEGDLVIMDGTLEMNNNTALVVSGHISIVTQAGLNAAVDTNLVIEVGGNWINDNMVYDDVKGFSPGTSTVMFNGNTSQLLLGSNPVEEFFNLTVDKAAGQFRPSHNMNVMGNLNILNGAWDFNTSSLSHSFRGDFTIEPSGAWTDQTCTVSFTGDADQSVMFAGTGTLPDVVIDKTSAENSKSQTVTLISGLVIDNAGGCSLIVDEGTFDLNGNTLECNADIIINDGGMLDIDQQAVLKIGSGHSVTVNNGGIFQISGSEGNEAFVTRSGTGYYDFDVQSGGEICAEYAVFEYIQSGLHIHDGGVVCPANSFNNCTFQNGNAGSSLLIVDNDQTITVENAGFPANTWGGLYNVAKSLDQGEITFVDAQGDFAGKDYENDPFGRIFWESPGLDIDLKVFLEGPFTGSDMNTTLNSGGHLPFAQPYNQPPWNYAGTEAVGAIPNADVVDWILVELRDAPDAASATSATIVAQKAAFLLKNGSIVSTDGSSLPLFTYTPIHSLFAVLWHRNHIGIMSAVPLVETGGVYIYDFTTGAGQAYGGSNAHKELAPGIWGMTGADGNADGQINNGDKNDIWAIQAGTGGYLPGDFNLDAQVNNGDKNDVWVPNTGLGGQVPDEALAQSGRPDPIYKCQVPD